MKTQRFKVLVLSLLAVLLLASAAVASADQLVQNSTFAPTSSIGTAPGNYVYAPSDVPDWSFSALVPGVSGSGIAGAGSAFGFTAAPSGSSQVAFVQMGKPGTLSSVSQIITGLIAGDQYLLTFSLEGRPGTGGAVTSVTIGSTTLLSDVVPGNSGWTSYDELFTATGTSEILDFFSTAYDGQDTTTAIDDPQIVPTPEPESLLLLGTGLFGLALTVFRKAKSSGLVLHS
jgi:hypothetical protein